METDELNLGTLADRAGAFDELMAVGHASIKEISMDFGFSSQAALNKYVEQKFGMTPVQLKNRLKNGDYGTEV